MFPLACLDEPGRYLQGGAAAHHDIVVWGVLGAGAGLATTVPGQAIGLPTLGRQADDAIGIRSRRSGCAARVDLLERDAGEVDRAERVIFTSVTLSDQPKVAVEYHSGMTGMSLARSSSACWYLAMA